MRPLNVYRAWEANMLGENNGRLASEGRGKEEGQRAGARRWFI